LNGKIRGNGFDSAGIGSGHSMGGESLIGNLTTVDGYLICKGSNGAGIGSNYGSGFPSTVFDLSLVRDAIVRGLQERHKSGP
jgi:hypothetical protein